MVNYKFIAIRTGVIFLAIITAFVIYYYIARPIILEPLCMVNSNSCVRIAYYSYNNSALIHMRNTGIWIWYNGDKAYIYGQPVGQLCKDPKKYQAAYAINTRNGLKEGYDCVMILDDVIDFYKSKKVSMKYLLKSIGDNSKFNVYDVLNLLSDEGVINLHT